MQGANDQLSKSTVSHAEGQRRYEEFPQSTKQLDQARPQWPFGHANPVSGCKQVRKVSVFVYVCVPRNTVQHTLETEYCSGINSESAFSLFVKESWDKFGAESEQAAEMCLPVRASESSPWSFEVQ